MALDFVVHLNQLLLPLLLLVFLHELLQHLLGSLLALLPNVLFNQLVDRADLVLARGLQSRSTGVFRLALALAALSFLRPFFPLGRGPKHELRHQTVKLALIAFA